MPSAKLQEELEALRREISQAPIAEDIKAAAGQAREAIGDFEKVLGDLQDKLTGAAEEAEDAIAAHPFAAVAAAFLLGVLVANLMSRGR